MIYLKTALDLTIGMIGMIILIRMTGKKTVSNLTPFDLVYLLFIGGILEQVLYEDHRPITYVLWSFFIWGLLIWLIEKIAIFSDSFRRTLEGRPAILILDGKLNRHEIKRNKMELEQIRILLRKSGCFSLRKVKHLVLEIDGSISILTHPDIKDSLSYLLIDEGEIEKNVLLSLEKDEQWLTHMLEEMNYFDIKDIYYAEWSEEGGFYLKTFDESDGEFIYIDG